MIYPWQTDDWQRLQQLRAHWPHALLLHGEAGIGKLRFAQHLAQGLLCETPAANGEPCGACPACLWFSQGNHPDYRAVLPEALAGLAAGNGDAAEASADKADGDEGKKTRTPSKEIKIEQVRALLDFCGVGSHRGGMRVVVLYPAEALNVAAANALLKTLEEPPGDVRFVLATEAAHQLLPTIRSRCLGHTMSWPKPTEAAEWLSQQGVGPVDVQVLLRAAGGRPEDALSYSRAGVDAKHWAALPRAVSRGDAVAFADWSPARVVDGLLKLCHDLMAVRAGASPRFFAAADLPQPPSFDALATWSRDLARTFRTVEHPYNAGLLLEALVSQGHRALHSGQEIRR